MRRDKCRYCGGGALDLIDHELHCVMNDNAKEPLVRRRDVNETAWLIETDDPVGVTLYFCHDGDWCSNPNHAHKFQSAAQAKTKLVSMHTPKNFRVAEHEWCRMVVSHD